MILAAPLVIPFAEIIGVSIAALGMSKAADMVNDYIQENPEQSMKILSTIVPNVGIGQIFANKEDSGEDNDSEDVAPEDRTKAERAAEMKKRFKEGKGDKREIGKKAYEEVIKPAKDMEELFKGEERIDGSIEEVGNPKFDFTKFYKNRRRKADGGAIGIEVLFEEKKPRKNFNTGGTPYDARASATDFARAIDTVGAGTNMQKAKAIQSYDQNVQRQNMVNRIQKMNPAGTGNFLQGIKDFGQHAMVSEAMAGKTGMPVIPEYGFQTGLDFQEKFSGLDPKISAGLAAAYQTLQEGSRALNPFGDTFLRFPTAMKTAQQQATKNIEGILAADTGTITPEQQAERNKYLASQGQPTEPVIDQSRISEIVEQQKAAGVPDEGLITNFNRPTMADVAGPAPDAKENYAQYKARMLESLRKNHAGQKTATTDLQPDGSYSGVSREIPIEDYFNYMLADKKALGFDPITGQALADGGRVGLFMGGSPLDGQALAIYNSMKAYDFTDQEIADALAAQGLYTAGGSTPDTPDTTIQPIGFQSDNGGGGGITELDPLNRPKGTPFDLNSLTKTKFGYNNALGRTIEGVKDFTGSMIDKFSGSKIGEGITSGATKFKNMAFTPMMALMQKRNPLNPNAMNYNPNLQKQMDFLEGTTGTRVFGTSDNLQFEDAAMIGRDPNSGLAKYGPGSVLSGQNVVSGFGTNDYEEQLANYVEKMRTRAITKTLSKFQQQKLEAAMAELGREKARQEKDAADKARAANADVYAELDKITGGKGYGDAGGFSTSRAGKEGAFGTFGEGRGRKDFSEGGLATMFTRKR